MITTTQNTLTIKPRQAGWTDPDALEAQAEALVPVIEVLGKIRSLARAEARYQQQMAAGQVGGSTELARDLADELLDELPAWITVTIAPCGAAEALEDYDRIFWDILEGLEGREVSNV